MKKIRYMKPIEPISFTGQEMLSSLFSVLNPSTVASINQLHGDRRGVVRVTCKTMEGLAELDNHLTSQKLHINKVRVSRVGESGHFGKVCLVEK